MQSDPELQKILSRVGRKSSYKYPADEGKREGRLKDRVGLRAPSSSHDRVPYWIVVDLIERAGEPDIMRFGYYRRSSSQWGSQTTLTSPLSTWKRTLIKAAREKQWFRDLLQDVMKELQRP
jgi:hypothetical protein